MPTLQHKSISEKAFRSDTCDTEYKTPYLNKLFERKNTRTLFLMQRLRLQEKLGMDSYLVSVKMKTAN